MDNYNISSYTFLLLIFIIIYPVSGLPNDTAHSTLIAMYMVGSDLESGYSLATEEIKEILSGLSEDQGTIDLEVAYGGSRAVGWSGMTIADLDTLKKDISDGSLGNYNSYPFRDVHINMGNSSGLLTFLNYIKTLPPHNRNILLFWDHGASYGGLCFDENYYWDSLTLQEIEQALNKSQISWDLIGMDACLMGAFEVICAVDSYADLLLVSEEVVPGHGWDYEMPLRYMVNNPDISTVDWGRIVIDAYMDNPSHEKMKKTLSLIDLKKAEKINEKLSILGEYLQEELQNMDFYKGIGSSFFNAQRFGYDPKSDKEVSVDLGDFSQNLENVLPQTNGIISDLTSAIASSVIYQRNDGSRPKSTGISTISPRNRQLDEIKNIPFSEEENDSWPLFIESYLAYIKADSSNPTIIPLGNNTFQIDDDQGIQTVSVTTDWLPEVTNFSHSYGLKAEPVYPDTKGFYIPNPDDKTFYLVDKNTGNRTYFFHSYLGNDFNESEIYFGYVNITRNGKTRETVINIIQDKNGEISYSFIPFEINPDTGEMLFSRIPLIARPGDSITPIIVERFFEGEPRYQYTPLTPVVITGELDIIRDKLPYGAYLPALWAFDYNMNSVYYLMDNLRFPNNVSLTYMGRLSSP